MIWIVTDSSQELKTDRENGLVVARLGIIANGEPMHENFTSEEFYQTQQSKGVTLTTSQVSPALYMEIFEELLKNPEDEVIVITLASTLSGTYNSARLARSSMDENRIHLIDSQNVSFSLALLVQEALDLRNQGKSAQEIVKTIEADKKKVRLLGLVPTLEYLKRGGRISATTAAIGDLVGIKPILTLLDGQIEVPVKVRGMKKAYNSMARLAKEWDIDLDRPMLFGYTGLDPQPGYTLKEAFESQLEIKIDGQSQEGCYILATHTGPEGAVVGFFVK